MIKLENICKSYDEKTVLDNIMAEFPDDSITCIMGESGAGKTTLVRIIAGQLAVQGLCHLIFRKTGL